jgi:hypothetical protein
LDFQGFRRKATVTCSNPPFRNLYFVHAGIADAAPERKQRRRDLAVVMKLIHGTPEEAKFHLFILPVPCNIICDCDLSAANHHEPKS